MLTEPANDGCRNARASPTTTQACRHARSRPRMVDLTPTPSFRLDGKRALVTGAGRGIGLACASALADAGAHVTLAARTANEIEEAAEAIRARGQKADALTLDVTDVEAARKAHCGARRSTSWSTMPAPTGRRCCRREGRGFRCRLRPQRARGLFHGAGGGAASWSRRKEPGSIINMSSQMGHVGAARRTVYCATKHAMEGFTKAMAIELAPHKIRVNSLGADLPRDADDAAVLREQGVPRRGAAPRSSSAGSASWRN